MMGARPQSPARNWLVKVLLLLACCLCLTARLPKAVEPALVSTAPGNHTAVGELANTTTPAASVNATNTSNANLTVDEPPGAGLMQVVLIEAVKDVPKVRKNKTEYKEALKRIRQTAYAQAITEPPPEYQFSLDQHNFYRAKHIDTPSLVWDDAVASSALSYARQCIWGHDTSNNGYGENLYAYSAVINTVDFQRDGLKAWYDEVSIYSYDNPGFSHETGHFTQMVWKSSARLGCAVVNCPNGMTNWPQGRQYYVCRYSPPGNYQGQFGQEVMPVGNSAPTPAPAAATPPPPAPKPSPSPRPPAPVQQPPPSPVSQPATAPPPPPPPPPPATPTSTVMAAPMQQGQRLPEGRCLTSPNTVYKLCLRSGGNLQVENSRSGAARALWSNPFAMSFFGSSYALILQPTGKLSVVSTTSLGMDITRWSANMDNMGSAPYRLLLQDDGDVSVFDSRGYRTWHSNTVGM